MTAANSKSNNRCLVKYCAYGHQFIFTPDRDKFAQSTLKKGNLCLALSNAKVPAKLATIKGEVAYLKLYPLNRFIFIHNTFVINSLP